MFRKRSNCFNWNLEDIRKTIIFIYGQCFRLSCSGRIFFWSTEKLNLNRWKDNKFLRLGWFRDIFELIDEGKVDVNEQMMENNVKVISKL